MDNFQDRDVWFRDPGIRIRFFPGSSLEKIMDADPDCPERLTPNPFCLARLDPNPVNIRPDPNSLPDKYLAQKKTGAYNLFGQYMYISGHRCLANCMPVLQVFISEPDKILGKRLKNRLVLMSLEYLPKGLRIIDIKYSLQELFSNLKTYIDFIRISKQKVLSFNQENFLYE